MECPKCNAEIVDDEAAFCPRCGAPLGAPDAEATGRLEPAPEGDTRKIPAGESTGPGAGERAARGGELIGDAAGGVRRYLIAGGWTRATQAAAVGFLALLAVGAVFVVLAKLLNPDFGSGESPLWMLTRIVIAGLWSIGVAIERADAGSAVLPVGALLVVGWILTASARRTTEWSTAVSLRERALEGLKTGLPFALMCFVAALLFRIRSGREVGADPAAALLVGLVWGSAFGALGGARSSASFRELTNLGVEQIERRLPGARAGLWAGGVMLVATALLALGAVLLFLVVGLATGRSVPLSLSDAIVFVVVLAAFLPNLVAGAAAFSLGAPIEFLARTIDGAEVERRASLILGGEGARGYAYLLLVVPAIACLLGGFAARRRAGREARVAVVLGAATATYALTLWIVALVTGVRVSEAFIGTGNYLVVSAGAGATLLLAALWAGVFGFAGWRLAEQQEAS